MLSANCTLCISRHNNYCNYGFIVQCFNNQHSTDLSSKYNIVWTSQLRNHLNFFVWNCWLEVNEFSSDLVFDMGYCPTFKKIIKIVADKILKNVFPNKVQVQPQVKQRSKSTGLLPHHSINQIECLWVNWICLPN